MIYVNDNNEILYISCPRVISLIYEKCNMDGYKNDKIEQYS